MTPSTFTAKHLGSDRFALFEDGQEFARLQLARGKWLLSTANVELKRLFDATEIAADATVVIVLRTVRAILDHIRNLAEQALKLTQSGFSAHDLDIMARLAARGFALAPVREPAKAVADDDDSDGGALVPVVPIPPKLPPLDAIDIPFAVTA